MEIRRVTEGGLQRDPTRRLIHASPTRIKNSPAVNVTQRSETATLARKVPAAYLLPNCCKDALVTNQIPSTHEFLKSDLHALRRAYRKAPPCKSGLNTD